MPRSLKKIYRAAFRLTPSQKEMLEELKASQKKTTSEIFSLALNALFYQLKYDPKSENKEENVQASP